MQCFMKESKLAPALISYPSLWYPETVGYKVCHIEKGALTSLSTLKEYIYFYNVHWV